MRPYFPKIGVVISLCLSCTAKEQTGSVQPIEAKSMFELKVMADSCYSADDYKGAVKYFTELIDLGDSLSGEVFYKRGFAFGQLGDLERSSFDFEKAAIFKYREADAYYVLGLNATMRSDIPLAESYLNKSLKINPQKEEALILLKSIKEDSGQSL